MRGNEEVAAGLKGRHQRAVEVGQRSGSAQLEGLAFGGRHVVGAAPDVDLLVAVLLSGRLLVQALEVAVHALVELPRHVHRKDVLATRFATDGRPFGHAALVFAEPLQPALRHGMLDDGNAPPVVLGQGQHRGHLGADKGGHVNFVDRQMCNLASARDGLLDADVGEGDVDPAGEAVGRVPHGLPMTHQDEQGHGTHVDHGAAGHEASHDLKVRR